MFERLKQLSERYSELEGLLSDPAVIKNQTKFQEYAKEMSRIESIVKLYRVYAANDVELASAVKMLQAPGVDPEMKELCEEEKKLCVHQQSSLKAQLEEMLLDAFDTEAHCNTIVEIRAGTGGEEAALFVSDLYRMYTKYASSKNLSIEVMNTNPTGIGGLKEIIFTIVGEDAYRFFRFEAGTHRVQRVPETETSGRIHTSAVTVAVLPEVENVEVDIEAKDLRIDVYRSSGPGGQSVNTTDSAVRITHDPTGIVVTCQDEKSQHKNRAKAMRVLRARLYEKMQEEQANERAQDRKTQVGTGDRSGRIRTYNYPDRRVTDHRINLTLYNLERFLEGEMGDMIDALLQNDRQMKLLSAQGGS